MGLHGHARGNLGSLLRAVTEPSLRQAWKGKARSSFAHFLAGVRLVGCEISVWSRWSLSMAKETWSIMHWEGFSVQPPP